MAAWKTVTSQPRRASSLAATRGTVVPPPESLKPNEVRTILRPLGRGRGAAGTRAARDAQLAGEAGQRQDAALQGVGQHLERAALGGVGVHDAPVELGHELAQRRGLDQRAQRVLHLLHLERLGGLVGEVVAVAAQADERPAGHVAEAEGAHRAQPEVEVLGEAEVTAVAADGLVDAAVDHARRVDERVVLAHEMAQQLVAARGPGWATCRAARPGRR